MEANLKTTRTDTERLEFLEREANKEPILLHSLPVESKMGGFRGLGLKMGGFRGLGLKNTGRSLRQAIDDMMGEQSRG